MIIWMSCKLKSKTSLLFLNVKTQIERMEFFASRKLYFHLNAAAFIYFENSIYDRFCTMSALWSTTGFCIFSCDVSCLGMPHFPHCFKKIGLLELCFYFINSNSQFNNWNLERISSHVDKSRFKRHSCQMQLMYGCQCTVPSTESKDIYTKKLNIHYFDQHYNSAVQNLQLWKHALMLNSLGMVRMSSVCVSQSKPRICSN